MILRLTNVGRLKEAEVKIDGLTVICGKNNTGKSTIGKVLFCVFDSFHDINNSIREEKLFSLRSYLVRRASSYRMITDFFRGSGYKKLIEIIENEKISDEEIRNSFAPFFRHSEEGDMPHTIESFLSQIHKIRDLSDIQILTSFLERRISSEFDGKLGNLNHSRKRTKVELIIKNNPISFYTVGMSPTITINSFYSLDKNLVYLDDPFLIDQIDVSPELTSYYYGFSHRERMARLIAHGRLEPNKTVIDEILLNNRVGAILEKINEISNGELIVKNGQFLYHHSGLKSNLGISSVSTGVKAFIIIKELIMNGSLEENGILVLDEPEVHLHPEWQIQFAEIIVLIQKAFNLNIVLTTHSMDFLSSIVHYSKKYEIERKCNYYLTDLVDDGKKEKSFPLSQLKPMNSNLDSLFASVSEPYLRLYKEMND